MSDLFWSYTLEEIERTLQSQVSDLGDKLDHIDITWAESESEFVLWLHPIPVAGVYVLPGDGRKWSITTIAHISKYDRGDYSHDNFSSLREAGRKLYFQLRKNFPVKRALSVT